MSEPKIYKSWDDFLSEEGNAKDIKNYITKQFKIAVDGEDLFHNLFLKLHNKDITIVKTSPLGYVYRVVKHMVIDQRRNNRFVNIDGEHLNFLIENKEVVIDLIDEVASDETINSCLDEYSKMLNMDDFFILDLVREGTSLKEMTKHYNAEFGKTHKEACICKKRKKLIKRFQRYFRNKQCY